MEMNEESLADIRKENAIKTSCVKFDVNYIDRHQGETAAEKERRHITLFRATDRERRKRARAHQSPEERRSTQDANTVARKRKIAQQLPEEHELITNANTNTTARKRQREQLSHDECRSIQNADTVARKRKRAQQSQEKREDGRRQDREARRRKRSLDDTRDSLFNDDCFRTLNPPDENLKRSLVMKAIKQAIRTKRPDGRHQATVCAMMLL